ncbi:MAG: T9SS type A sorting domain-containing protein [Bacteroidota bacterium]
MIFKQSIVAGIAMLLLYIPLKGEIIASLQGDVLSVETTLPGSAGYHGCEVAKAQKVPAYVFELQVLQAKDKGKTGSSCGGSKGWNTLYRQESEDGTANFDQLPLGVYRVISLTGEAIGCRLNKKSEGLPDRSIIYRKEISKNISIAAQAPNSLATQTIQTKSKEVFSVFPNPASNELSIELQSQELSEEVHISLIDLLGKTIEVARQAVEPGSSHHRWNLALESYPPGAYFIHVQDAKGKQFSQKIVVQKNQ